MKQIIKRVVDEWNRLNPESIVSMETIEEILLKQIDLYEAFSKEENEVVKQHLNKVPPRLWVALHVAIRRELDKGQI